MNPAIAALDPDSGRSGSPGSTTSGLTIFNANNSAFYFDRFDINLALGAQNQLTLFSIGYLVLPQS